MRKRYPQDLEWLDTYFVVDEKRTPFEVCELGHRLWVAAGHVPGTTISIVSRGVPLDAVKLQRITDHRIPPPPKPDLGEKGTELLEELDQRFERISFHRIRRWGDYWALLGVETEHIEKLEHAHRLSLDQALALSNYWNERIRARLDPTFDRLERFNWMEVRRMQSSRIAGRLRSRFLCHLWFNTLGPGSKTWFGIVTRPFGAIRSGFGGEPREH